jgi:hypothetical protein
MTVSMGSINSPVGNAFLPTTNRATYLNPPQTIQSLTGLGGFFINHLNQQINLLAPIEN